VLDRDLALVREVFDFSLSAIFPVVDVLVAPHPERPTGEDDGADVVVETGGANSFLEDISKGANSRRRFLYFMRLGRTSFLGQDKSSANPDAGSTEHERCSERLAIEQPASCTNLNGGACIRRGPPFA
jgi:hypothetical protein